MDNAIESRKRIYHGGKGTKLYEVWCSMKQRCFNPNNKRYKTYGARGIAVCEEWKNNFEAFYDYVSKLPHFGEEGRSIDRIDNNGNYEPGNVRWATRKTQANNQQNTIRIEYKGITRTLNEWGEILGVNPYTLYGRIFRNGMSVERAFRKLIQHSKSKKYGIKKENPKDKIDELSTLEILTEISVNEVAFIDCLKLASTFQIQEALKIMRERNEHDKSRINYCSRELKRRNKSLQKMNEMEGKE